MLLRSEHLVLRSNITRSSAVPDGLHDALCLSVQYLECSLLLLVALAPNSPVHTIKFCSVVFGLHPSPDENDVQACCRKQDSLMLALRRPSM